MQKHTKLFFAVGLLWSALQAGEQWQHDFLQSFAKNYDFNAEGRYTHEYHPFLLAKTRASFKALEARLQREHFNLAGRMVIAGYEENAIPSYYSDYRECKINDEMSAQSNAGWSLRLHNRFGLMTGYLLKDFNTLAKQWWPGEEAIIEHINPQAVELFSDEGGIFQEHAFGDAFGTMLTQKRQFEKLFKTGRSRELFSEMIDFWQALYRHELMGSGRRVAATQDVLFSIEYAKYLRESSLPITKYYTGPDLTYPIETNGLLKAEATRNAQDFVQRFAPRMKAVNGKKTAYVFCSFVDGVGKSTMLGNVRNWQKHGKDVASYERVDNSSSQYATLYEVSDDVCIADLPAQVSHFTYKPDGLVYVKAQAEISAEELARVHAHVRENQTELIATYRELYTQVREVIDSQGLDAPSLCDEKQPHRAFMKNIITLKKEIPNTWVPFTFSGKHYLFNFTEPLQIRVLGGLEHVSSYGLKNIEPEQMLFFAGVRFPLPYDQFLQNFIDELKKASVQEVVFVDFISMYPRSSRENIRINYLLQQLALLDDSFDQQKSLYKNFVSPAELFSDLLSRENANEMYQSFELETAVRLAIYTILQEQQHKPSSGVGLQELSQRIRDEVDRISSDPALSDAINEICNKKFNEEYDALERTFGRTKELENVQRFSFLTACEFSDEIHRICTEVIEHPRMQAMWQYFKGVVGYVPDMFVGKVDRPLHLEDGTEVLARHEFSPECKNTVYLGPFARSLRASWYATLSNLLFTSARGDGKLLLPDEKFMVPPTRLTAGLSGQVYMIQKKLAPWQGAVPQMPVQFNLSSFMALQWGAFRGAPYCMDWDPDSTSYGLFGFDCNLGRQNFYNTEPPSLITTLVQQYQKEVGGDCFMPTSLLYKRLRGNTAFREARNGVMHQAKKNGHYPLGKQVHVPQQPGGKGPIFLGRDDMKPGAQLFVLIIATLEMVLKDVSADVAVRRGHKGDFIAAVKLLEEAVLPQYFGIAFAQPLFENYDALEPVLGWDAFN